MEYPLNRREAFGRALGVAMLTVVADPEDANGQEGHGAGGQVR